MAKYTLPQKRLLIEAAVDKLGDHAWLMAQAEEWNNHPTPTTKEQIEELWEKINIQIAEKVFNL